MHSCYHVIMNVKLKLFLEKKKKVNLSERAFFFWAIIWESMFGVRFTSVLK